MGKSLPKIRLFSRPQILSRTARKMKVYNVTCLVGKYQIEHVPHFLEIGVPMGPPQWKRTWTKRKNVFKIKYLQMESIKVTKTFTKWQLKNYQLRKK